MHLQIQRAQRTASDQVEFGVTCQLVIEPEEQALIDTYKALDRFIEGDGLEQARSLIYRLTTPGGAAWWAGDLRVIEATEGYVVRVCEALRDYLYDVTLYGNGQNNREQTIQLGRIIRPGQFWRAVDD